MIELEPEHCEFNLQYTLLLLILKESPLEITYKPTFTIHFATINTADENKTMTVDSKFTIHFATINTILFHQLL